MHVGWDLALAFSWSILEQLSLGSLFGFSLCSFCLPLKCPSISCLLV